MVAAFIIISKELIVNTFTSHIFFGHMSPIVIYFAKEKRQFEVGLYVTKTLQRIMVISFFLSWTCVLQQKYASNRFGNKE